MYDCPICDNAKGNRLFSAKEMMFGLRDDFEYVECANCECLRISNIPENLGDYYPDNYYSLSHSQISKLKLFLKRQRGRYSLNMKNIGGKLLTYAWGEPVVTSWLKGLNLNLESKILDVGSGLGSHLKELHNIGFQDLTGVDPFIKKTKIYSDQFRILKKNLNEIEGPFDFIMMNHSLEHIYDQFETLTQINRLLKDDGHALIRIPLTGTFAWKKYKSNWVQLDAPRHLFLHSKESFSILAKKTNFDIKKIVFDSTEFQFTGSEGYLQGKALTESEESIFTRKEINEFKEKAQTLNNDMDGDQACFFLQKTN